MEPIIISVAPNGAKKTREIHPDIPLLPEEIARDAQKCMAAGAVLLHMHIRNAEQKHTLDVDLYRKNIDAVKNAVGDGMIIQVTSESAGIYSPDQQMQMIRELKPRAASFAVREFFARAEDEEKSGKFFHEIEHLRVFPQFILHSPEDARHFAILQKKGLIPAGEKFVLFVLGKKNGGAEAEKSWAIPDDLDPFLEVFADEEPLKLNNTHWAVCAFGGNENACMLKAVECGGHVRVGFENNHLLPDGSMAKDNAELITEFVKSLEERGHHRKIANIKEAGRILGTSNS